MHVVGLFLVNRVLIPVVVFVAEHIFGWRTEGTPPNLNRYMLVTEPHTSNVDIFVFFYWACKFRLRVYYIMKKEAFEWFGLRRFFVWSGGIPIDREAPLKSLKTILKAARENENFILLITPSGTRSYTEGWKPGFYYIAQKAKLPLVPSGPDYATKTAKVGAPVMLSGDIDGDVAALRPFLETLTAKHPERNTPIRIMPELPAGDGPVVV